MSIIQIKDLSFTYPEALEPLFEHVNLNIDTSWRLGLIGRNGRGKTTFLNLLLGKLKYTGSIFSVEKFEYFPVNVGETSLPAITVARGVVAPFDEWEKEMAECTAKATPKAMDKYAEMEETYAALGGYTIDESITAEVQKLGVSAKVLAQPYKLLSGGEKIKLLLAAVFLKKHHFLLIDEPTDHLDAEGRHKVAAWLAQKSGYILVSHDRLFLDEAVNHILSVNRANVELQKGNYTTWRENRDRQDAFELAENRRLEAGIASLKKAAEQTSNWSDKIEKSKNTSGATYNRGPAMTDKGFIGHKAAKMMQRSKAIEQRRTRQIEEKQGLLKNIETAEPIKFHVLKPAKKRLITLENVGVSYSGRSIFSGIKLDIEQGERIAVVGANGSGKSTLLKLLLGQQAPTEGSIYRQNGLVISSLPQHTDFLRGNIAQFAQYQGIDESLFMTLLRKLDFEREAFARPMESYSAGQKKKACLAASLAKPAHLFIWDEPMNYIDVISREQVEEAVLRSVPTMVIVEHDTMFLQRVATRTLPL